MTVMTPTDLTTLEALCERATGPLYRFLDIGEIMEAGDECPSDNCVRWEPVNRWAIGCARSSIIKIVRRRVAIGPPALVAEVRRLRAENKRLLDGATLAGLLDQADDVWTDYGSGFRIHFSFLPSHESDVILRINRRRARNRSAPPSPRET